MIITNEDRVRMGTPNPLLLQAVKQQPVPQFTGSHSKRRKDRADHLAKLRYLYPIPAPIPDLVQEVEHTVSARDGFQIPIKIYKPAQTSATPSPVIMMMHEGGWSMGDLTDEDLNCRMFSRDLDAVCVNVDYRLSPEHPWPKCVHDCWDVVQWIAKNAEPTNELLPGDLASGFLVGGASAGGNLAAVMAQLGRDNELKPPLTGQYLCVPVVIWKDVVPEKYKQDYRSQSESLQDPVLGEFLAKHAQNIAGPGSKDPRFSPLLHENLQGLPACYFQVAGLDPLRDEALIYEHVLNTHGVPTKLDMYDGYGHMFWTNWPQLDESKVFVQDTLNGFKWLLNVNKPLSAG